MTTIFAYYVDMKSEQRNALVKTSTKRKKIANELNAIAERERDLITAILEDSERGDQKEIAQITGLSRERIRQISGAYYRTVKHRSDGRAFIEMASDDIHEKAEYELRGKKGVVIGRATGKQLLDARNAQIAKHPEGEGNHVDVVKFLTR